MKTFFKQYRILNQSFNRKQSLSRTEGKATLNLLLGFVLVVSCQSKDSTDLDIEKLTYLKQVEWPKAYAEQDTILLNRILGEDFQMVDGEGNWFNKRDEIEWIKKNSVNHDSFHYEIKRLDMLPNGTAIICGTGHIRNDTVKSEYQSSNIFIKRSGVWKAIASHVSGYKIVK